MHTIQRLPAVKAESGYSRSTIYLRISQGLWTKQVRLGPRCVGWPEVSGHFRPSLSSEGQV
jgi:prophage regulatory protein